MLAGHPQTRAPQKGVTAKLVPTVYLQLDGFRKKKMSNSLNLNANLEPGKIFQIQESFKTKNKKKGGGVRRGMVTQQDFLRRNLSFQELERLSVPAPNLRGS